jgi:hypothetical protein
MVPDVNNLEERKEHVCLNTTTYKSAYYNYLSQSKFHERKTTLTQKEVRLDSSNELFYTHYSGNRY